MSRADLESGYDSSRTYTDRLLILNLLRYRFEKMVPTTVLLQRILSNHLELGETTAGKFFLEKLIATTTDKKSETFLRLYQYILKAMSE